MKTLNLIPLLVLLAVAGAGCSKSKSGEDATTATNNTTTTTTDPAVTTPTGTSTSGTASNMTDLTLVSNSELANYSGHAIYAPTNVKVTVNLQGDDEYRYYGTVRIAYDDNGVHYEGVFDSGSGTNPYLKDNPYNGWKEYTYNTWFDRNTTGQRVFSGYFQDTYGAIVLTIDGVTSTANGGDAQGGQNVLTGSIWYMNFQSYGAPQGPYRKCWFIYNAFDPNTLGATPYDCRSWALNDKAKGNLEPSDHYRKLGTFTTLLQSQAFH